MWEYTVIYFNVPFTNFGDKLSKTLNEYGAAGWDIFETLHGMRDGYLMFLAKRYLGPVG